MRPIAVLSLVLALALAANAGLPSMKRRRDLEYNLIHHEYHGPPAPLAHDGRVVDTEEVAQARAHHLAIHAETITELAKKKAAALDDEAKSAEESDAPAAEPADSMPKLEAFAAEEPKAPEAEEEPKAAPVVETPKEEPAEARASSDAEKAPETYEPKPYEGPLAPIGEDGRVVDTEEVLRAKEAHLYALEEAAKLMKAKETEAVEPEKIWYHSHKTVYVPHAQYYYYPTVGPIGYSGPKAPIDDKGRVVDTEDVERAKEYHRKAYEQAEAIAQRHPPSPADNAI